MKNLGRVVGINVFFNELEKETGEPKLFEYTYGAGAEQMNNEELFFINGVFVFVWNVTNSAYDIYPEHRIHSVGVVYENDNQPKPGRQIVSFGVPPEAQQQRPMQRQVTDDIIEADGDDAEDDDGIELELDDESSIQ